MTGFTLPLAAAQDAAVVGGKGASLGELARAGITVPGGFAVTVSAFASALAVADPDGTLRAGIEALPADDVTRIAEVAGSFRERIAAMPVPREAAAAIASAHAALGAGGARAVAVRSSATAEDSAGASFAGLGDTYLGVRGAASVLERVRRCWASLYNDESVVYRRRIGVPEAGLAMAVVVQNMIAPRAAGVMFTRSPVTGDRSVVAIEGTWGLGSALVAGDVTPDSFAVAVVTGEITARRVSPKPLLHAPAPAAPGSRNSADTGVTVSDTPEHLRGEPCLTDPEILALARAARRVEAHFGAPQDIEWALLDAPPTGLDAPTAGPDAVPEIGGPGAAPLAAPVTEALSRVVLLQSRPETVWAARAPSAPVAAPLPRPADHVLSLFTRPL